jgi:hypothetical protein
MIVITPTTTEDTATALRTPQIMVTLLEVIKILNLQTHSAPIKEVIKILNLQTLSILLPELLLKATADNSALILMLLCFVYVQSLMNMIYERFNFFLIPLRI